MRRSGCSENGERNGCHGLLAALSHPGPPARNGKVALFRTHRCALDFGPTFSRLRPFLASNLTYSSWELFTYN